MDLHRSCRNAFNLRPALEPVKTLGAGQPESAGDRGLKPAPYQGRRRRQRRQLHILAIKRPDPMDTLIQRNVFSTSFQLGGTAIAKFLCRSEGSGANSQKNQYKTVATRFCTGRCQGASALEGDGGHRMNIAQDSMVLFLHSTVFGRGERRSGAASSACYKVRHGIARGYPKIGMQFIFLPQRSARWDSQA
jgi:hypothetical protein